MNRNEIQNLIRELIEKTTIPMNNIAVSEDEAGTVWFSVETDHPHFFLGRKGEGLFALNHLVRKIIEVRQAASQEAPEEEKKNNLPILLDINGFQKKRIENVRAIAHMMAERARYFKSNIEVDPMPAFERRIVHEFLAEASDLKTESVGEGAVRRVVIKYIGGI
jgi:spoIIIJ-associated protein